MMTRRAIRWLSLASENPARCREAWQDDLRSPQLLSAGAYFDVLVIDQRTGMETFDQLQRRAMPVGAVMIDRAACRMGFFLPARSGASFERALARATDSPPTYRVLSTGSFVVVPGPMALTGDRFEWLNAPVHPQHPSPLRTVALGVMLAAASDLIARADEYGREAADAR